MEKVKTRTKLSALWAALMFSYQLADVLRLYSGDYVAGDEVAFDLNYGALLSAMTSPYVDKVVV